MPNPADSARIRWCEAAFSWNSRKEVLAPISSNIRMGQKRLVEQEGHGRPSKRGVGNLCGRSVSPDELSSILRPADIVSSCNPNIVYLSAMLPRLPERLH